MNLQKWMQSVRIFPWHDDVYQRASATSKALNKQADGTAHPADVSQPLSLPPQYLQKCS